jgi:hypothetical protein
MRPPPHTLPLASQPATYLLPHRSRAEPRRHDAAVIDGLLLPLRRETFLIGAIQAPLFFSSVGGVCPCRWKFGGAPILIKKHPGRRRCLVVLHFVKMSTAEFY